MLRPRFGGYWRFRIFAGIAGAWATDRIDHMVQIGVQIQHFSSSRLFPAHQKSVSSLILFKHAVFEPFSTPIGGGLHEGQNYWMGNLFGRR